MTQASYDPTLVMLSIVIAVIASYTALDLAAHLPRAIGRQRWAWIGGASLAMGGGIWSMHFVGMLAFRMAMPVLYGFDLTVLSLLIAIGVTAAAFTWVSQAGRSWRAVLLGGPLMGVGIAAMHYTGMAAMRMPGDFTFSVPIVALSVLIAVTAATAALWLTSRPNGPGQKAIAAIVMGFAVAGMHYTGMAAATFTEGGAEGAMFHSDGAGLGQQNLGLYVAAATFVILFLAMLASSYDHQRTDRALRASEARFRAAAEAVGDIIWTNSPDGQMIGAQPDWAAFTGQTETEYQGHGWAASVHPDDVSPTVSAWDLALAQRRIFIFEHRVRRHDGVYRTFAIRAVPVRAHDGAIHEWVGVHSDITERQEFETALRVARDEAEQANIAKSTFIANMSHELRTPLSAIIGYSEMMLEEVDEVGDTAGFGADMRKIQGNARHLLGLINDVLDLSKVESGKMNVYSEAFELEYLLGEIATTGQGLVARKSNRLEVRLTPGLDRMVSDLTKVRQILLNLLSNAAKFTDHGVVTLSAFREKATGGDTLVFAVADTGIGISPAQLPRLFQRFVQADASTTRKYGGTGLGLSLTKAFAEMLGGSIAVESREGEGTTFTVRLPATYDATPTAELERESRRLEDRPRLGDRRRSRPSSLAIADAPEAPSGFSRGPPSVGA